MNKILVVDDDRMVLNDNRQYFEKLGYEVICADTSARAEEIIGLRGFGRRSAGRKRL